MRGLNEALVTSILSLFTIIGCEGGDWLGPVERGLRAAVNGWDMWATDSVRPYEDPLPDRVEGTIPTNGRSGFTEARREAERFTLTEREDRAKLVYRRYCQHCHGSNGDGRVIVGESLDKKPTDLRSAEVQSKTDQALYHHLKSGGNLMLPLAATISPLDMLLVTLHVRALRGRPSTPYFSARDLPVDR